MASRWVRQFFLPEASGYRLVAWDFYGSWGSSTWRPSPPWRCRSWPWRAPRGSTHGRAAGLRQRGAWGPAPARLPLAVLARSRRLGPARRGLGRRPPGSALDPVALGTGRRDKGWGERILLILLFSSISRWSTRVDTSPISSGISCPGGGLSRHPAARRDTAGGLAVPLAAVRLRFESGLSKLISGDPGWRDLSALNHYFETQPLPHAGAWYAHQLPDWLQRLGTAAACSWSWWCPSSSPCHAPGRLCCSPPG